MSRITVEALVSKWPNIGSKNGYWSIRWSIEKRIVHFSDNRVYYTSIAHSTKFGPFVITISYSNYDSGFPKSIVGVKPVLLKMDTTIAKYQYRLLRKNFAHPYQARNWFYKHVVPMYKGHK